MIKWEMYCNRDSLQVQSYYVALMCGRPPGDRPVNIHFWHNIDVFLQHLLTYSYFAGDLWVYHFLSQCQYFGQVYPYTVYILYGAVLYGDRVSCAIICTSCDERKKSRIGAYYCIVQYCALLCLLVSRCNVTSWSKECWILWCVDFLMWAVLYYGKIPVVRTASSSNRRKQTMRQ